MKTRDLSYDIVKLGGVFCIVLGHAYFNTRITSLFYVPLFWIVAGYFINDHKSIKKLLLEKVKRLYIPFVVSNTIYCLVRNLGCSLNMYSYSYSIGTLLNKFLHIILFNIEDEMGSASWFLFALFISEIFFYVLMLCIKSFALNKNKDCFLGTVCLMLFLIGYVFRDNFNTIVYCNCSIVTIILISMPFYLVGYFSKKYEIINNMLYQKSKIQKLSLCIGLITIVTTTAYVDNMHMDYRSCHFTNCICTIIIPYLGFIFFISIAGNYIVPILEKFQCIKKIIAFSGQNTLYILLYHVIGFQIVSFVQVKMFAYSYYDFSGWSSFAAVGLWKYLAAFLGIIIPLILRYVVKILKQCIRRFILSNVNSCRFI